MRIVKDREASFVGSCIYCGTKAGGLGEEHISPFGLNGCIVLLDASCLACAKETCRIENHVLRHMWGAARAELGFRTRDTKGRRVRFYPLTVMRDGVKEQRMVPLADALRVIELPIFEPAATLDGREYAGGINCISKDSFVLKESKDELARRHGVDAVCAPSFDSEIFARFVAKVCLGYAVERYGTDAFESIYLRDAILGRSRDIGMWVGSPSSRELRVRMTPMSVGFKVLPDNDVLVRVKLFPRFDGAEYVAVVGKMKVFYADQYRLIRGGREAAAA